MTVPSEWAKGHAEAVYYPDTRSVGPRLDSEIINGIALAIDAARAVGFMAGVEAAAIVTDGEHSCVVPGECLIHEIVRDIRSLTPEPR